MSQLMGSRGMKMKKEFGKTPPSTKLARPEPDRSSKLNPASFQDAQPTFTELDEPETPTDMASTTTVVTPPPQLLRSRSMPYTPLPPPRPPLGIPTAGVPPKPSQHQQAIVIEDSPVRIKKEPQQELEPNIPPASAQAPPKPQQNRDAMMMELALLEAELFMPYFCRIICLICAGQCYW